MKNHHLKNNEYEQSNEAKSLISNILHGFIVYFESDTKTEEKKQNYDSAFSESLDFIRFVLNELSFNNENPDDVIVLQFFYQAKYFTIFYFFIFFYELI